MKGRRYLCIIFRRREDSYEQTTLSEQKYYLPQCIPLVLAACEVSWPSVWLAPAPVLSHLWSAPEESAAIVAGLLVVLR